MAWQADKAAEWRIPARELGPDSSQESKEYDSERSSPEWNKKGAEGIEQVMKDNATGRAYINLKRNPQRGRPKPQGGW